MSIFTAIGMCSAIRQSKAATTKRELFEYFAPLIGTVSKTAFESIFGVRHRTLYLYRKHVREHGIAPKQHGGTDNKNAQDIDEDLLVQWFADVAQTVGDVVPVQVRRKSRGGTQTRRDYSSEDHTLLPPSFTWAYLTDQYLQYLDDNYVDTPRPSESSVLRILTKRSPTIRIRALETKFAISVPSTATSLDRSQKDRTPRCLASTWQQRKR